MPFISTIRDERHSLPRYHSVWW